MNPFKTGDPILEKKQNGGMTTPLIFFGTSIMNALTLPIAPKFFT